MSEKYYTPKTEDFHVGFEYEYAYRDVWENRIFNSTHNLIDIERIINKEDDRFSIRVPYLNKEHIRMEGWRVREDNLAYTYFNHSSRPELTITFWNDSDDSFKNLTVICVQPEIGYEGPCKSINEFRTIMKLLNIK